MTDPVWMTKINGKIICRESGLTTVNEKEITKKGEEIRTKVFLDCRHLFDAR